MAIIVDVTSRSVTTQYARKFSCCRSCKLIKVEQVFKLPNSYLLFCVVLVVVVGVVLVAVVGVVLVVFEVVVVAADAKNHSKFWV